MFRRILSVLLCLLMLFSCTIAMAEDEMEYGGLFDLRLMKDLDMNARQWMQDEETRAYFTCIIMLDFALAVTNEEAEKPPFEMTLVDNESYIGRNGLEIYVMFLSKDMKQAFLVMYRDGSSNAGYFVLDVSGRGTAEYVFAEICPDGYYKNDVADMRSVSLKIKELLDL